MRKFPRVIQDELDKIPGRWRTEMGARHIHILVDGRLAAIFPRDMKGWNDGGTAALATRAQIRRAARQEQRA